MSPKDFIQALNQENEGQTTVEGRPYFPFLRVDTSSEDSIMEVTITVLLAACHDHNNSKNYKLDYSQLIVTPIQGGNTNSLFRVSGLPPTWLDCDSVLVRVFGAHGLIDRHVETATYAALARASLIPAYYGRFGNGRIEAWLDGMRPLQDRELAVPEISRAIARQMAQLHVCFVIPPYLRDYHNPQSPGLWTQITTWMTQALQAVTTGSFVDAQDATRAKQLLSQDDIISFCDELPAELEWLRDHVIPQGTAVAFCHNDVLASNIMYKVDENNGHVDNKNNINHAETTATIQLIDFEYGSINFIAFDIANHFNEFAGGTTDGVPNYDWFPSKEFQRQFIQSYLEAAAEYNNNNDNKIKVKTDDNKKTNDIINGQSIITQQDVTEFHNQVQAFILVNHLYWGLWGVNQASTEGCRDFDYLYYGSRRIKQYYHCKAEFLSSSLPTSSSVAASAP